MTAESKQYTLSIDLIEKWYSTSGEKSNAKDELYVLLHSFNSEIEYLRSEVEDLHEENRKLNDQVSSLRFKLSLHSI